MIMLLVAFFFFHGDVSWIWWSLFCVIAIADFIKFCRDMT